MSGGFDILTATARAWLGTGPTPVVLGSAVDWPDLERLAFLHGLEPLLHHLGEAGAVEGGPVPAALAERWEKAYYQNHVFNSEAVEALGRLERGWAGAGLAAAVIKGPATLARGWGEPGLRPMVDLDVLCRERELPRLVEVAQGVGFEVAGETSVYHLELTHSELALGLELHFGLYDFLPRRRELHERLLAAAAAVELELDGEVFRALPPAEALAMNVAHLVNHDFRVGLRGFLDLAVQARRGGARLVADDVLAAAVRFGLVPELELAAALVDRLFAVELAGLAGEWSDEAARVEAWLRDPSTARPALEEMAVRPGWWSKAVYVARLLFPPRSRLSAAGGSRPAARRGHLAARLRSALRHGRSGGVRLEVGAKDSIKRRVYQRRRDG